MDKFKKVFGRTNAVVIGMVHVDPLPGTPRNTLSMSQIVENSLKEVKLYLEAGVVRGLMLIVFIETKKNTYLFNFAINNF